MAQAVGRACRKRHEVWVQEAVVSLGWERLAPLAQSPCQRYDGGAWEGVQQRRQQLLPPVGGVRVKSMAQSRDRGLLA